MPNYTYRSEEMYQLWESDQPMLSGTSAQPLLFYGSTGTYSPRAQIKYVCAYCGSDRANDDSKCINCGATKAKEKHIPRKPRLTPIQRIVVDDAVVRVAEHAADAVEDVVHSTVDSWKNKLKRKLGL